MDFGESVRRGERTTPIHSFEQACLQILASSRFNLGLYSIKEKISDPPPRMIGMDDQIQPEVRIIQSIGGDIALQGAIFVDKPQAIPFEALYLLTGLPGMA